MRSTRFILAASLVCAAVNAGAGTLLDFWHSYTPPQTGEKHYSFRLCKYKRGLFLAHAVQAQSRSNGPSSSIWRATGWYMERSD